MKKPQSLETAMKVAKRIRMFYGYGIFRYSGTGDYYKNYCIANGCDRPIAEGKVLAVAIMKAVRSPIRERFLQLFVDRRKKNERIIQHR
jgi:hypothetical protein